MTQKATHLRAAMVGAGMASVALWAACAGPDFMTAASNDGGTGEAGGDVAEEIVVINCPRCWDVPDAVTDAAAADGDEAGDGGIDAEAGDASVSEGGSGSNGPELSLLAGGLGGPGNADGVGAGARFFGPAGVATDRVGNLYVSDNLTIRKMVLATAVVSTIAGAPGISGSADGVGSVARFNSAMGVATDNSGNLYAADRLNATIRRIALATGAVTTLAGSPGMAGSTDATGAAARFNNPMALAFDGSGNLYVGDMGNSTVRKIVVDTGEVTTIAGTAGATGSTDGAGAAARFNAPRGLATDNSGNLFISDSYNFTIRQLVLSTGAVTSLAGSAGMQGRADGTGSAARFSFPFGLAADGSGNLYVADSTGYTIRKVVMATGEVTTLAGSAAHGETDGIGPAASFDLPAALAADGIGNVYVADAANPAIRKIVLATGAVTTVAGGPVMIGNAEGTGSSARFNGPVGVTADGLGHLYVSDVKNATIREVDIGSGAVTTLAGTPGLSGSADGIGRSASFGAPYGVVLDDAGNLYVADGNSSTIRRVIVATGEVSTFAGSAGAQGSVDGTGSAARFVTPYALAADTVNLYVTDRGDNTIRQVALAGAQVKTLAGTAGMTGSVDGTGPSARFFTPEGIAYDAGGSLYVADKGGNTIRKIVVATGEVSTIAGSPGITGGSDGSGSNARFNAPTGLSADGAGNLYVADTGNGTIRKIDLSSGKVTTWIGVTGQLGVKLGPLPAGLNSPQGIVALSKTELAIVDQVENAVLLVH